MFWRKDGAIHPCAAWFLFLQAEQHSVVVVEVFLWIWFRKFQIGQRYPCLIVYSSREKLWIKAGCTEINVLQILPEPLALGARPGES